MSVYLKCATRTRTTTTNSIFLFEAFLRAPNLQQKVKMRVLALATAALLVQVSVVYSVVLPLERAFPLSQKLELSQLRARDRVRHPRILQAVVGGVVDFSVEGTSDPYLLGWFSRFSGFLYVVSRIICRFSRYGFLFLFIYIQWKRVFLCLLVICHLGFSSCSNLKHI